MCSLKKVKVSHNYNRDLTDIVPLGPDSYNSMVSKVLRPSKLCYRIHEISVVDGIVSILVVT